MSHGAEAIDQITHEIETLAPDQLVPELTSFLNEGHMSRIIATDGIGLTLKCMRAVEQSIPKVDDPEARTLLGTEAVRSARGVLLSPRFEPDSFESAATLLEQSGRYALLIEDSTRVDELSYVAEGAVYLSQSYSSEQETYRLGLLAASYIDRAVETAKRNVSLPSEVSGLRCAARVAARTAALALRLSPHEPEQQQLAVGLIERPIRIYDEALAAAKTIAWREPRLDEQARIANAMASSTVDLAKVSPDAAEQLFSMAVAEVGDILAEYDSNNEGAAYTLTALGGLLAETVATKYRASQDSTMRQQLIDNARQLLIHDAVEAFQSASNYVELATDASPEDNEYRSTDFSRGATRAAQLLLDTDFASSKRLFRVGFELAVAHDKSHETKGMEYGVLREIETHADRVQNLQMCFELYSLRHQLEKEVLPKDQVTDPMKRSALDFLGGISEDFHDEIDLSENDSPLVEFIVKTAMTDDGSRVSWTRPLSRLSQAVADPLVKQRLNEQVEILRVRDQESKRPNGKLARIANEHWPVP